MVHLDLFALVHVLDDVQQDIDRAFAVKGHVAVQYGYAKDGTDSAGLETSENGLLARFLGLGVFIGGVHRRSRGVATRWGVLTVEDVVGREVDEGEGVLGRSGELREGRDEVHVELRVTRSARALRILSTV